MRIGIFTNNYIPILSGVSLSVKNFREGLEKLGHDVFVFAPAFKGYKDKGNRVFRYPSFQMKYKFKYPLPFPSIRDDDFARDNKLELIHSQHPWGIGRYALKIARQLNIPIIFTNHTRYSFYVDYLPKFVPRKLAAKFVEKSVTKYANKVDAVIAPTDHIKEYLIDKGVTTPIHVAPTGVDPKDLLSAPDGNLKKKYNIPEDYQIIFNLSRVSPEKNVKILLKAYEEVLKKKKKVALVVAGEGPDKKYFEQLVKEKGLDDRVFFIGAIPFEKRGGYFKEGDVFMHASLSETQGLVMVDSLVVGVPVVAIEATGVVDVVEDGKSGLITKNSAKALAEGTLKVLNDSKLRAKLSKGAKARGKRYSILPTARRMESIYKTVLG